MVQKLHYHSFSNIFILTVKAKLLFVFCYHSLQFFFHLVRFIAKNECFYLMFHINNYVNSNDTKYITIGICNVSTYVYYKLPFDKNTYENFEMYTGKSPNQISYFYVLVCDWHLWYNESSNKNIDLLLLLHIFH